MWSRLLGPPEQSAVDRFSENVSLHRLHDVGARLEGVAGWLDIELGVQRVELEHIMMLRPGRRRTRTAIHLACRADLIASIRELRTLRYSFRQPGGRARNVPDDPMCLIVRRAISRHVHVAHVEQ